MRNLKSKVNEKYLSKKTALKVEKEVLGGLKLLNKINRPIVSIFGSHLGVAGDKYYDSANEIAYALGKEGYAIMTGGGPGIMRAANGGAMKAKTESIGVIAGLIKGEKNDMSVFTHQISLEFVFVRRFILSIKSDALVFYPGGFGTLNELFEFLVLIQTGIDDKVPVILVHKKYWEGLDKWLKNITGTYLSQVDLDLIQYADTKEDILKIIQSKKKK